MIVNDGKFINEDRKINFGLEASQKFDLNKDFFVKLGFRIHQFKKTVYAVNQVPELHNYPYPFNWEYNFTTYTIPIHVGKNFYIKDQKRGDWYFGVSMGVLSTSSYKATLKTLQPKETSFTEIVSLGMWDLPDNNPTSFYSNFEIGGSFIPFKQYEKWSVGVNLSAQLNKTEEKRNTAIMEVPTMGYDFFYEQFFKSKIFNFSAVISYQF